MEEVFDSLTNHSVRGGTLCLYRPFHYDYSPLVRLVYNPDIPNNPNNPDNPDNPGGKVRNKIKGVGAVLELKRSFFQPDRQYIR